MLQVWDLASEDVDEGQGCKECIVLPFLGHYNLTSTKLNLSEGKRVNLGCFSPIWVSD